MTFLLNVIPALLILVGLGCSYYFYRVKNNLKASAWSLIIMSASLFIYQAVQPSYIPKTGVPPMKRLELQETSDPIISDRSLKKAKTTEEREEHFEKNVLTYDDEIKKILEEK